MSTSNIDTDKLAKTMEGLLGIRKSADDSKNVLLKVYKWKKGAILYEDDEIINYSLVRRLKQRISNEIIDINRVVNVKVHQNKDDLIFWISLK